MTDERDDDDRQAASSVAVVTTAAAFGELLASVLPARTGLPCIGFAGSVEGLDAVITGEPTIVVCAHRDGESTVRLVRRRWPSARVVVVSDAADAGHVELALSGAAAVLPLTSTIDDIARAVVTVDTGVVMMTQETIDAVRSRLRGPKVANRVARLRITPRERQILELVGQGMGPATIAEVLGISIHTCRGHVKNLMSKVGVHSQLELGLFAAEVAADDRAATAR